MLKYNYALEYQSRTNPTVHEASFKGHLSDTNRSSSQMMYGYIGPASTAPNINAQIVTMKDFPNGHPK